MYRSLFVLFLLLTTTSIAHACSCFGPQTFCETMDSTWTEPDVIVLGVKLDVIHYGMRVKVVEVIDGSASPGDTLMVWGDNGALCRIYVNSWANGDTVLWAFHNTDFMGNWITAGYPPDLEQPGHYHISICGLYWLSYANGQVTGAIEPGMGITTLPLSSIAAFAHGCLTTNIPENEEVEDELFLLLIGNELHVRNAHAGQQLSDVRLFAMDGRLLVRSLPEKQDHVLVLTQRAGCYVITAKSKGTVLTRRFVHPL